MYISNVYIENFRNFSKINIPLKQFTIISGKNDSGKSNFIDALNIVLYNDRSSYYAKSLSKYDFNKECIDNFDSNVRSFYNKTKDNFNIDDYIKLLMSEAPKVVIRLRFEDPKDVYEQALLRDWLNGDEALQFFEVEYIYFLKNVLRLRKIINELINEDLLKERHADFQLFLDCYEYSLKSTNNDKDVDITKIRYFVANNIGAERDYFAGSDTAISTKIITSIIDRSLNSKDKATLTRKYDDFFKGIQSLKSFKCIYDDIISQNKSIEDFINEIKLVPNAKKYKDIIENITLSYGNDMLFQRGLGTRNLIFLLTLYSHFLYEIPNRFNIVSIEEPESHLDINNLKTAIEFFMKAKSKKSMTQLIISTHNNQIMNKLELINVVIILNGNNAIALSEMDSELVYYLAKRENFDTLNMLYATKLILVEGATEEIYINSLLHNEASLNNIRVISIGQKGFKMFIKAWLFFHKSTDDKLGVIRDYDNQKQAKIDHESYNSDSILVRTSSDVEFEYDFINETNNLEKLNELFNAKYNKKEMYDHIISDKLNNIITICNAIDEGKDFSTPEYISSLLEWIKK